MHVHSTKNAWLHDSVVVCVMIFGWNFCDILHTSVPQFVHFSINIRI